MTPKIDLNSVVHNGKKKLRNILKRITSFLWPYIFITSFICICICIDATSVDAASIQNDKLIERISKDYTNKFCNSIAFGLSKQSAMDFAKKENDLIFTKKKGFDSLNKELISNKIANSVIETCGYLISLKGEEGVLQFEREYK